MVSVSRLRRLPRVAAASALAAALAAQEPAPPRPPVECRFCAHHGEKDCKRHRRLLEEEQWVELCSVAAACRSCRGALTIDCRICRNEPVEAARDERIARVRDWLAARRAAVDEVTGGEGILHARSAHVDLAFSIRPLTVGRRKLDTHRLMHLYLRRVERLRAEFLEVFGASERDFSARLRLYLFEERLDHDRLSPRVAGGGAGAAFMKLMGVESVYCMYREPRSIRDDEALHRTVAHNVAHLLLANMKPEKWLGNRGHGWVDAGVAHYFEDLMAGRCTTYCYEEVGLLPGSGFKDGRWRVPIRRLAESGKLTPFTEVSRLNTDQLEWQHHAEAFAYVDFLISEHGGEALADLVRLLKRGEATRDALPDATGISILRFDEAFRAWVRAHYPLQDR